MRYVRRWAVSIIATLLFLVAMWQFLPTIDEREFHRDEARWIHRAEYLRELVYPFGDYWDEATWSDGDSMDARNRLRAQPPMGSYLMGVGFLLQGQPLPDIGYWNMDYDDAWNANQGNMPTDEMLTVARRTTATLSALTVVMIFLIGTRLTTITGATIGAIYLAVHPLTRYLSTFAGSDAALVFFIALATLSAARLAEKPTWLRAVLLGIAIGCGGATKLSPLGIAFALASLGAVLLVARRKESPGTLAKFLLLTPIIAGITFVLAYPYLWRHPIENSLHLLRYRSLSFDIQGTLWQQVAVETRMEAVQRIWQRFSSAEWSVLGRFFGWGAPVENLLVLAGITILGWLVYRRGLASSTAIIAVTMGAAAAITIMGLQVDWARYQFPTLLAMALGIGIVAGSIEQRLIKRPRVT